MIHNQTGTAFFSSKFSSQTCCTNILRWIVHLFLGLSLKYQTDIKRDRRSLGLAPHPQCTYMFRELNVHWVNNGTVHVLAVNRGRKGMLGRQQTTKIRKTEG